MLTLREEKNMLRTHYRKLRASLLPDEKAWLDRKICGHFLSLASYRYADTLLIYYPLADEIDTRPIIQNALQAGKKVALPRCREDGEMDFYFISHESDLTEGKFGIREPQAHCPLFNQNSFCKSLLIILPGLAFDRKGFRLGYGKGYYDRYLSRLTVQSIGLAYASCITDRLPRGRFDLPVNLIISEKGVNLI